MSEFEKRSAAEARIIAGCEASRRDIEAGRVVSFDAVIDRLDQRLRAAKEAAREKSHAEVYARGR